MLVFLIWLKYVLHVGRYFCMIFDCQGHIFRPDIPFKFATAADNYFPISHRGRAVKHLEVWGHCNACHSENSSELIIFPSSTGGLEKLYAHKWGFHPASIKQTKEQNREFPNEILKYFVKSKREQNVFLIWRDKNSKPPLLLILLLILISNKSLISNFRNENGEC